jgi:RimJ/RimL family protein N-acetyltransferase
MRPTLPAIFTSRLALVPANSSDLWGTWDIWSEPDVQRRVFGEEAPSLEAVVATFESWAGSMGPHLGLWMIRTALGRQLMGCVSLARRSFSNEVGTQLCGPVEFQIAIKSLYRRKGHAFEATRVVLRHAFSAGDLPFIMANTDAHDLATSALLGCMGFRNTFEQQTARGARLGYLMTREDFSFALAATQAA